MSGPAARFETAIEGVWGTWPAAPKYWSYSSLKDIEACPRRWMLSRARYPDLWTRAGYPEIPGQAALFGDVVHEALEVVVQALSTAGCTSTHAAEAVAVIRGLGGLSTVLKRVINDKVDALMDNPRIDDTAREELRQRLVDRLGDATNRVQVFLSRGQLPAWAGQSDVTTSEEAGHKYTGAPHRPAIGPGAWPEVDLVAENLRFWGRIDLVLVDGTEVTITDYKTGQEDPSHDDQVRLYALLWDLDEQRNPGRLPAANLVVSYLARDHPVPPLTESGLRTLESATSARIAAADSETNSASPQAKPGPETCPYCQVRHLCEDYWTSEAADPASVTAGAWFDLEGTVTAQQGIKSWRIESEAGVYPPLLLRTPAPSVSLPLGARIRLLGVRKVTDPDDPSALIGALTSTSEIYVVNPT
ncbi:PD-(D/E)XK nuclease family protein [Kribbella sp. NPDC023972]|uniref:PD-(D/E)XK nuclease family protein n=1 Tax=Kribbella sp. NPDC023972 TaxID=3154795 RepID=UPI0033F638A3